jgi:hypothetical protein
LVQAAYTSVHIHNLQLTTKPIEYQVYDVLLTSHICNIFCTEIVHMIQHFKFNLLYTVYSEVRKSKDYISINTSLFINTNPKSKDYMSINESLCIRTNLIYFHKGVWHKNALCLLKNISTEG